MSDKLFSYPELHASYLPNPLTTGMDVTLTCDTTLSPNRSATELQFAFYRDGQNVQEFGSSNKYQIQSIQPVDFGYFTCEVKTVTNSVRKKSRIIYVRKQDLFSFPRIKVSPQEVTEDVEMTLTCYTSYSYVTGQLFAFYRDGEMVQAFSSSNKFQVQSVKLKDSRNYTCEITTSNYNVKKRSRVLHIQIQELFSFPQIELSPQVMIEREKMTLTCNITARDSANLLFAFYRDGEMVQGFSPSNKYQVQAVKLEDSGNYTCEVRTSNYNVKKKSRVLHIQILGPTSQTYWQTILITCLSVLLLIVVILAFVFRHKLVQAVRKQYRYQPKRGVSRNAKEKRHQQSHISDSLDLKFITVQLEKD
ncbi:high affinity immunoglobulin gamma Fc receptor I-like [Pelobates fuscus]|uniref:high affinity immunoglobulin gamma Fc receptor I-like n=1 Tax=Pelobates fuscus TaxID=191477 RepID=UPI002FE4BC5B